MKNYPASFLPGLLILACSSFTHAQDGRGTISRLVNQDQQAGSTARTSADETFDLNIPERYITRSNYRASTEVEIIGDTARAVSLSVGVAVSAGRIGVLLRNVTGKVRFKASLDPVLNRINSHRKQ
jgi:hypothetical protein